jgi:alpha-L-fucosidase 2
LKDWENHSFPIGNGYLGGSVFGGVGSEQIILNEHTLWLLLFN